MSALGVCAVEIDSLVSCQKSTLVERGILGTRAVQPVTRTRSWEVSHTGSNSVWPTSAHQRRQVHSQTGFAGARTMSRR